MSELNPKIISVPLKQNSYPIWIQREIKEHIHELLKPLNIGQKWFLLTPTPIFKLYGKQIVEYLKQHQFAISPILLEDGETVKSFHYYEKYCRELVQKGCNRDSYLIALGGGVTGDLTGFIASSLYRGVNYIQIPTTLLAMVDSSIGGKTGINIEEGKNLIGAFYHPKAVIIDPKILNTLPHREVISGMGEVLKYGIIQDVKIMDLFINLNNIGLKLDSSELEEMIFRSINVKIDIVAKDVNETDLRRILNFGHTVGHIIEASTGYNFISHGEAVIHGMIIALQLSIQYCNLEEKYAHETISILKEIIKPELPEIGEEQFNQFLMRDKKVANNKINFVLLNKQGLPEIRNNIELKIIYNTYRNYCRSLK